MFPKHITNDIAETLILDSLCTLKVDLVSALRYAGGNLGSDARRGTLVIREKKSRLNKYYPK
ncbi:hypothetical protein PHLCEN_2v13100 [Hermanssonia centrifuga]|uniref:Uncharacterized protein n=1 Tax=Hermanssonia centrifuga TaxID=98765 RepID=A0A2R6NF65_9APHY|nr:hypothetical protein PHLCEN_2v13100 [Hermanssonia centrifuga]